MLSNEAHRLRRALAEAARVPRRAAPGCASTACARCPTRTTPICMTTAYVDARLPNLEKHLEGIDGPISAMLERTYGVRIARVEQSIQAIALGKRQAKLLKAEAGSPALLATRRYYREDGTLIELSSAIHPSDRFTYVTSLVGRELEPLAPRAHDPLPLAPRRYGARPLLSVQIVSPFTPEPPRCSRPPSHDARHTCRQPCPRPRRAGRSPSIPATPFPACSPISPPKRRRALAHYRHETLQYAPARRPARAARMDRRVHDVRRARRQAPTTCSSPTAPSTRSSWCAGCCSTTATR